MSCRVRLGVGLLFLGFACLPAAHAQVVSGSYVGDGTAGRTLTGLGFRPDIVIVKVDFDGGTDPNPPCISLDDCSSAVIRTSTMVGANSKPVKGNQAPAANMITAIGADGFTVGNDLKVNALDSCPASTTTPCTYYWTAIKADPNIKIGSYVGNNGTQSIVGLGFSPEWVATIPADTSSPMMRFSVDANTYHWWSGANFVPTITSLDANGFTVQNGCGAPCNQNSTGVTYYYIAMNDTPGHVKVGTYTGDGTSPRNITSGINFEPTFVMTKGLSPGTYEQVIRSPAMPALESMTFRGALTSGALGNSGKRIRGTLATGFILGGGGGPGNLVNDATPPINNYAYLLLAGGSGCCNMGVAETASTITVTGPNRYELSFNQATGAGLDQFFDLTEDPSRANDLVGGTGTGKTLYGDGLKVGGPVYNVTQDDVQGKLDLLEATPVRVRTRQEAFYKQEGGSLVLAGVKGTGDYSIYGSGRIAFRWNQRATSAVTYTLHDVDVNVHMQSSGPLSTWVPYSETDGSFTNPGTDKFFVVQNGGAGARTDFLQIISKDWTTGNGYLGTADSTNWFTDVGVNERGNPYWEENTGATINAGAGPYSQQPGETWNFLTYFKPTNFTDNTDTAVITRSDDYRVPDSLSVTVGQPWIDGSQNTGGGDDYNESEGAYLLTLDTAAGLTFQIDGTAGTPRYSPFFKIRQWRSFVEAPVVRLNGTPLVPDTDYRAAVKPLSRAHWTSILNWHCTMENGSACDSANLDVGTGVGTSTNGTATVAGRYGNGLLFTANTDRVTAASTDFVPGIGAVEFWYQPQYASGDGLRHLLWYWQAGGGADWHCYWFEKSGTNQLQFNLRTNYSNQTCTIADGNSNTYSATVAAANFSWRANDWVYLKTSWNTGGSLRKLRIVVNGVEAATSPTFTSPIASGTPIFGGCNLNCPSGGAANPNGILDEVHLYGGLELSSYDTGFPLAHGGLTSDGGEYLADTSKNIALNLTAVGSGRQGSYTYFGSDSPFRGLNVSLATKGVWATTPGDVVWEFWNGQQWATLESGFGFTDQTSDFTNRAGTIYWTGDPAGWAPYSVGGGPDLYYVRIHLAAGPVYATLPTENVIKTDILLFQYCGDITAAAQQFQFPLPAPTAVKLLSFTAQPGDGSVTLAWRTGSELDNLGFHVYRALAEAGPWTRVDASLIPGLGSSATGQAYSFRDSGLSNGTRYFYRLEDVDAASHATSHGPVSAVPVAGAAGGGTAGNDKAANGATKQKPPPPSCPDWVVAAYGALAGSPTSGALSCSRRGDPEAVSLAVVSRDSRQATLELRTGGFYALREASGKVRVFVPGFDFPKDPKAEALPFRRALVDAVVGRSVQLGGVRALEQQAFTGLVPTALGEAEMRIGRDGTVSASRRESREASPLHANLGLARLLPSVFQGETKSAVVEITPLRYDARRQQLLLAKRVLVKLVFSGRDMSESGRGSVGRKPKPQDPVSAETLVRLYAKGRGLHAATFEQLFPGQVRGLAASQLRLERQGAPVAFHLEPSATEFGPGGRFYFFVDAGPTSLDFGSEVAFELLRAPGGLAMPVVAAGPGTAAPASGDWAEASFETNRFYQPGLLEAPDPWLWDAVASGATRTEAFSLAGVDTAGVQEARLDVFLQGASESGNAVDHHLAVSVNGTRVGEAQFAGKKPFRVSLGVPLTLLREGANQLQLTSIADTGVSSVVFLDRFALAYPQTASLASGAFEGRWSQGGAASVAGATGAIALLDVTPTGARWLTGFETAAGLLRFRAEAGHRYLAVSQAALVVPRVAAVAASGLRSTENRADYILIAPRAFLAAAEPLVDRRRDQGLEARAVAFEEIADAFGHGQPSAQAIKSFLAFAFASWQRPSPRYVLLLGDSSYDPRNFTGTSLASPLPAQWTKTSYLWTVSDPELAAVNGDDLLPDLAIGRLPATTVEEAQRLVDKLLAWEDSGQGLTGAAVLVADNPDPGGDFEADVEEIRSGFLGSRARVLKLSELGAGTRPAIQEALDSGLSLLSYVGHGGAAVWASENVWNSWDAPSLLAQSRQPLLMTFNCLNGYFVAPSYDSLAESLLKAEGRGAIASFASSGLSLDGPAHQYHRALAAELTSGNHARLGDVLLAAQKDYAATGLMPELLSVYHLLGDPATEIRPRP